MRATEANDGSNYDGVCPGDDTAAPDPDYATQSGTSFAAPHAAALAAYLWSLDIGLSYAQVRQALLDNRVAVGIGPQGGIAGANRIDGFGAV